MKMGTVVDLKGVKAVAFLKRNVFLLVICFIFLLGVAFGVFLKSKSLSGFRLDLLERYFKWHFGLGFFRVSIFSCLTYSLVLLFEFMFGASLMGVAVVPFLVLLQGFWYGCVSSCLYSQYQLKGVIFNAIVLLPALIIFTTSSVYAAREGIRFSLQLTKSTLPKSRPINLYNDFKNYCGKFLVIYIFVIFASVTDAFASHIFLDFFENFTL